MFGMVGGMGDEPNISENTELQMHRPFAGPLLRRRGLSLFCINGFEKRIQRRMTNLSCWGRWDEVRTSSP